MYCRCYTSLVVAKLPVCLCKKLLAEYPLTLEIIIDLPFGFFPINQIISPPDLLFEYIAQGQSALRTRSSSSTVGLQ